jgi:hypothetical protein
VFSKKQRDVGGQEIPDDELDLDISSELVNGSGNGHQGGPIPAQEDILVSAGQGSPNLALVLLTGSLKPEEYLVRGRMPAERLTTILEILAIENEVHMGSTDMMGLIGWDFNASAGIGGQARTEAVRVGMAQSRFGMMRRGLMNRFRGGAGGGGYGY